MTQIRILISLLSIKKYANWKSPEFRNLKKKLSALIILLKKCFDEAPEDDRDSLQLFAFICNLSFDIYVKKQIVEKLLDNFPDLLHSENTGVKKDSAKKKK